MRVKHNKTSSIRVYYDRDWEEYNVVMPDYTTESDNTAKTDDKQDALDTANYLAKQYNLDVLTTITHY